MAPSLVHHWWMKIRFRRIPCTIRDCLTTCTECKSSAEIGARGDHGRRATGVSINVSGMDVDFQMTFDNLAFTVGTIPDSATNAVLLGMVTYRLRRS